jgi:hypothetical protein
MGTHTGALVHHPVHRGQTHPCLQGDGFEQMGVGHVDIDFEAFLRFFVRPDGCDLSYTAVSWN